MFQKIKHIGQLEHLQVVKEIQFKDKDDYIAVDYVFQKSDTFDLPLARECRGIKFKQDGTLLARPYHKFFNYGEKPETTFVSSSTPHVVLEKLDGSMVHAAMLQGQIVYMTRAGLTHVSEFVDEFIRDKPEYNTFSSLCLAHGNTPIYEFCSLDNRVVIEYKEPRLVLTGIRDNTSGEYISYPTLEFLAKSFDIPVVKAFDSIRDFSEFVQHTKDLKDAEGYVVKFNSGLMLKIKADEYCRIHRVKDKSSNSKFVLDYVLNGSFDDFVSSLEGDLKDKLQKYNDDVVEGLEKACYSVSHYFRKNRHLSRKEYAINLREESGIHPLFQTLCFKMLDDGGTDNLDFYVRNIILDKLNTKYESIEEALNVYWKDYQ